MNAVHAVHAKARVLLQNGCTDAKAGNLQDLHSYDIVRIWEFVRPVLTFGVKVSSTFCAAMLISPPRALERAPGMDSASSMK